MGANVHRTILGAAPEVEASLGGQALLRILSNHGDKLLSQSPACPSPSFTPIQRKYDSGQAFKSGQSRGPVDPVTVTPPIRVL